MSKPLPSPERLPAAQGFGRRGFAQANVKGMSKSKLKNLIFELWASFDI
jgi:hypothetical protein